MFGANNSIIEKVRWQIGEPSLTCQYSFRWRIYSGGEGGRSCGYCFISEVSWNRRYVIPSQPIYIAFRLSNRPPGNDRRLFHFCREVCSLGEMDNNIAFSIDFWKTRFMATSKHNWCISCVVAFTLSVPSLINQIFNHLLNIIGTDPSWVTLLSEDSYRYLHANTLLIMNSTHNCFLLWNMSDHFSGTISRIVNSE